MPGCATRTEHRRPAQTTVQHHRDDARRTRRDVRRGTMSRAMCATPTRASPLRWTRRHARGRASAYIASRAVSSAPPPALGDATRTATHMATRAVPSDASFETEAANAMFDLHAEAEEGTAASSLGAAAASSGDARRGGVAEPSPPPENTCLPHRRERVHRPDRRVRVHRARRGVRAGGVEPDREGAVQRLGRGQARVRQTALRERKRARGQKGARAMVLPPGRLTLPPAARGPDERGHRVSGARGGEREEARANERGGE